MKREHFGAYRLLRLLNRGDLAYVYEAASTISPNRLAVKIFHEWVSQDSNFRMRMQRNAPLMARLLEPHLVPIHNVGEIDGQLYVEMPLIDGTDLQAKLARGGPLSPARAVAIVSHVASALDAMHAAGLVSRNVTPGAILVTHDDFAYLLGFATPYVDKPCMDEPEFEPEFDDDLGLTARAHLDLAYWAPERFTIDIAEAGADVYALTCVLYECLAGFRPYLGGSIKDQVIGHLNEPPPKPTDVNRAVPMGFDAVIARGMAKKPEDRYASAGDLARAASDALG